MCVRPSVITHLYRTALNFHDLVFCDFVNYVSRKFYHEGFSVGSSERLDTSSSQNSLIHKILKVIKTSRPLNLEPHTCYLLCDQLFDLENVLRSIWFC